MRRTGADGTGEAEMSYTPKQLRDWYKRSPNSIYLTNVEAREIMLGYATALELLKESYDHHEYCGWGDTWERECARDSKLPERIQKALK